MFRHFPDSFAGIAFVASLVVLTSGCGTAPEGVQLNTKPLLPAAAWYSQTDAPGRHWLAYYEQDGGLMLRTPDGAAAEKRLNPTPEGGSSGLAMIALDDQVHALWRDKGRGKVLQYFHGNASDPGVPAAIPLDKDSQPLTRLKIAKAGNSVYALWLGEKDIQYALYFKHSTDGGATFGETQRVLDGIYPAWVVDEQGVMVFSWTMVDGVHHFLMRRYDPAQRQFGPVVDIGEGTEIPPYFEAFRSGSRVFLVWIGQYGPYLNQLKLQGAYSDDQGEHWQRFTIDETPGFDYSKVNFCQDGDNSLAVAYSARPRMIQRESKDTIYVRVSRDNGSSWGQPSTVRKYEDAQSQATTPLLACGKGGKLVVAWEDWRSLRPQVHANSSSDYGATWLPEDVPVGEPRTFISADGGASLKADGGQYTLITERYRDDTFRERDVFAYSFKDAAFSGLRSKPVAPSDEAALRQRVDFFWSAFEKEDFKTAYATQDPFFRAQRSYEKYASPLGKIKFHRHTIKAVRITGNKAEVDLTLVYSIPKLKVGNRDYEQPDTEISLTERWIFIDGNWFRVYTEESTGVTFVRY